MNASVPSSRTARPAAGSPRGGNLSLLKALLGFDALTCLVFGAVLVVANALAARVTGVPAGLLLEAGGLLLVFGAFVTWAAVKKAASRRIVMAIVDVNALWVVASIALAIFGTETATPVGRGFVLVQAMAVGILAAIEYTVLQKTSA